MIPMKSVCHRSGHMARRILRVSSATQGLKQKWLASRGVDLLGVSISKGKMRTLDLTALSAEQNALLNQISDEIRTDFHETLRALLEKTHMEVAWLVSSTFSRNNYQSDVFRDICFLFLAIRLVEGNHDITRVVLPSLSMERDLKHYFREHGYSVSVVTLRRLIKMIKAILRPYYKLFRTASVFLRLWMLGGMSRRPDLGSNQEITLITTFILKSSFNKPGNFIDRNYPGIMDYGFPEDNPHVYFVPQFYRGTLKKKFMRFAQRSKSVNFLIKNDYLKFTDYLNVLFDAARIDPGFLRQTRLRGVGIGSILMHDFYRNKFELTNLYGSLNYCFVRRLKGAGLKVKVVVDWYENQAFNKGLVKGFKDFYPCVEVRGYAGFIVDFHHDFHHKPTDYESSAGVIPDKIYVIGRGLESTYREFSSRVNVRVAPAYRFKHVLQNHIEISENARVVLVALPISYQDSVEALGVLAKVAGSPKFSDVVFDVKPHPALNFDRVRRKSSHNWPPNLRVVYGSFFEELRQACLMIGYNSSTCVEAIALGVPVIVVGNNKGFYQNPVPGSIPEEIWRFCLTEEAISDSISWFMNLQDPAYERIRQISNDVKKEYFEPPTPTATAELLSSSVVQPDRRDEKIYA